MSANGTSLTARPAWKALETHYQKLRSIHLRQLFADDSNRGERMALEAVGLYFDYSKNRVTDETIELLLQLAEQSDLRGRINAMFRGDKINVTEQRAVLHVALRAPRGASIMVDGKNVVPDVHAVLDKMTDFSNRVRTGVWKGHSGKPIRNIINIGIGGSDLGPALVAGALAPYGSPQLKAHFVSNVDGSHIAGVLAELNPETTLFIVASKTFTTLETLANARTAREWLIAKAGDGKAAARHFAAVTANVAAAREFGIDPGWTFEFWDWVGGRYSV